MYHAITVVSRGRRRANKTRRSPISQAIRLDPSDVRTYVRRARARIESREYDQGIADFDKAIELDPKSAVYFNNRGCAWAKKKEFTSHQ